MVGDQRDDRIAGRFGDRVPGNPQRYAPGDPRADSIIMLITVAVSTVVWLTVPT